ncbi:MAG TPA: hypothetical protein PLL69_06195 [Gemmatimonadales bacterium]|nr:hypothetical protein [Gemmatimonadales bacterium]
MTGLPVLTLLGVALAQSADTVRFTRLDVVLDSITWSDVRASTFLPVAWGNGYLAGPGEVRLCDRLSCLVLLPPDSAADRVPGDIAIGVLPAPGSGLAERLAASRSRRARIEIADPPPPPDLLVSPDSLPMAYYLSAVAMLVPPALIAELEVGFRSSGARVIREGQGVVVQFGSQELRVMPAWGEPGIERITLHLRRELPGNPTFRFGPRTRLRFNPPRTAIWTF